MAAFSYQHHHPFLVDSSLRHQEPNNINTCLFSSHFYQPETLQQIPGNIVYVHHLSRSQNHEAFVLEPKLTTDSSSIITNKVENGEQVSQIVAPMDRKRKNGEGSSTISALSKNLREAKRKKPKKSNDSKKNSRKERGGDDKTANEGAPTGYIRVRARRGQATDSHSLAERVRREKISERMKTLQSLVPGCDKVTGKALILDEIINYVQSLQHQVEFLSVKLASVNPTLYDFGVDLDAIMVRTDQNLNNALASPLAAPNMQPCNTTQSSDASHDHPNNIALTTTNNYSILDGSPSLVFHQGHMPNTFPLVNGQLWWDMDEQIRQILINQPEFSNNFCSFH